MIIETKRLILRQPTTKDIDSLIENINDLEVSKWLLAVPYPYTKEDAIWWINHCKEIDKEKDKKTYGFNIQLKGRKGIIGGLGLSKINKEQGTSDIGYWLGKKYHRQGIMTEAITPLIDFAFKKLKLRRLQAPIFAENKKSRAFAKSLGFKYEGRLRKAVKCKATGKIHDEVVYGLLKEEWKK